MKKKVYVYGEKYKDAIIVLESPDENKEVNDLLIQMVKNEMDREEICEKMKTMSEEEIKKYLKSLREEAQK